LLEDVFEHFNHLHFLVFTLFRLPVYLAVDLGECIDEFLLVLRVSLFPVSHFLRNFLLEVWEVLVDAVLQNSEAFFASLHFCLNVLTQLIFTFPERVVDALDAVLASLSHVLKAFLKNLLPLGQLVSALLEQI
jgi:hypothetical protein